MMIDRMTYFALALDVVLMPFLAVAPGARLIVTPPTPMLDAVKVPYPLLAVPPFFILTDQVFKLYILLLIQLPL